MGAKILVMDDDECMRELLRLHLANAGYEVLLAEDAIEAGKLILKWHPDLLLADVEMPYMNGLELVEAMKSDPTTSSLPVIFLTCKTEAEQRARQLGAAAFLMKPLRADQLLATVAQQVNGPNPI
jgi:two-component system chemotaxis response regulator CheY